MQSVPSDPLDMKKFQQLLKTENGELTCKDKRRSEDTERQTPRRPPTVFETMAENAPGQGHQVKHFII